MRLKTKLVLAITGLVFLIAGLISFVCVGQIVREAVQQSYDNNRTEAEQIRLVLQRALENGLRGQQVDPNNYLQLRYLEAQAVRSDDSLQAALDSAIRYSRTIYDVNIGDAQSKILLSTNAGTLDSPMPQRPNYQQLLNDDPVQLLIEVFGSPKVFDVVVPLERNGELFASVHVGVRTTLLGAVYKPWLKQAIWLMGFALSFSLLIAFLLSNLALRPMEQISLQLDYWTPPGEVAEESSKLNEDMATRVSSKIEKIGQRMRNVEEVFSALKENLDQILGNLQDGILLFTGDGRAVLVSEAACRFLHKERDAVLGLHARDIFDRGTVLGRALWESIDAGVSMVQEEIRTETGRRIRASVDFIHDDENGQGLGALVTLHDIESAEEIESELELSRRMAAIGRLTSGVGHEVKNPINAIVVHLELLKSKLGDTSSPATRHLEVIDAEIRRLDRVVQTLVDFSRPVELMLREHDLRNIVTDVLALAREELFMRNVRLDSSMPDEPLIASVDGDLLKQALLNVIENGAQAMPNGGRLDVDLYSDRKSASNGDRFAAQGPKEAIIAIRDQGPGIPPEIREKIFDLYFTTKAGGSGIGLAMTYRILQLHHGSVEVQSIPGQGTNFRLHIPVASIERVRRHARAASSVSDVSNEESRG
ncbi:MAG TPA: ATP-binding protein [Terracidiphilus sp.]|nr:ATP-binding protein [Terracidiphilus sp.]